MLPSDNEYTQNPLPRAEYFANLEKQYRDGGIVVPLYVNVAASRVVEV